MDNTVIARGLDQVASLVNAVNEDQWDAATPCSRWSVRDLVDHLVHLPTQFADMASGEKVDWAAPTPHHDDPAATFASHADALLTALSAHPDSVPQGMVAGELAIHVWDLASALGRGTSELDPEVAETGFAFMSTALTDEQRGDAFGPQAQAPSGANAYERLAAFAGREVPFRADR
ncbi:TIGR03086 family metal-binding protein [Aeromicrobium sp.]|uniref:TIGR03086 family metal-binding protein n=1 Tax=Aeromicrobium sp. TaxID=1871063 RepID=UPI0028AED3A1|nr:TIGR03086 family metal-binding protein [Aeromicrobium sp.]